MLKCKQAAELLSVSRDRRLSARERFRLRVHLFVCRKCTRYAAQLRFLETACRQVEEKSAVAAIRLSDEARQRLRRALERV
jgi:hypothetical protein